MFANTEMYDLLGVRKRPKNWLQNLSIFNTLYTANLLLLYNSRKLLWSLINPGTLILILTHPKKTYVTFQQKKTFVANQKLLQIHWDVCSRHQQTHHVWVSLWVHNEKVPGNKTSLHRHRLVKLRTKEPIPSPIPKPD